MASIQIKNNIATIKTNKSVAALCHKGTNNIDLTQVPALNRYIARNPTAVIGFKLVQL